jgi:succinate dehydrogenase / fumarate reductase flavoprotein subunit
MAIKGARPPAELHRQLGNVMWNDAGMVRNAPELKKALKKIPELREEFWSGAAVPGADKDLNQTLEKAMRVADFLEFSELLVRDALERKESCGGHFREESCSPDGEARRDDAHFSHVSVWEYQGGEREALLHKEPLKFEHVKPAERSYK